MYWIISPKMKTISRKDQNFIFHADPPKIFFPTHNKKFPIQKTIKSAHQPDNKAQIDEAIRVPGFHEQTKTRNLQFRVQFQNFKTLTDKTPLNTYEKTKYHCS